MAGIFDHFLGSNLYDCMILHYFALPMRYCERAERGGVRARRVQRACSGRVAPCSLVPLRCLLHAPTALHASRHRGVSLFIS